MSFFHGANNTTIYGSNFSINTTGPEASTERSVIRDLEHHVALGAFHDSRERYDPPKCLPHTRKAVFREIAKWMHVDSLKKPVLWLYGPAGSGKSAIAQSIAEKYKIMKRLVATFFFSRCNEQCNNTERLVPSLAYQFLSSFPHARPFIAKAIVDNPQIFALNIKSQLETLVIEPLRAAGIVRHSPDSSMLVVIDGIDECLNSEERTEFLQALLNLRMDSTFPLIFLCASRPESDIRTVFNSIGTHSLRLVLDNRFHPNADILAFLAISFQELKKIHPLRHYIPPNWPSNSVLFKLVRKSSGQFIYASTAVKYVASRKHRPPERLDVIMTTGSDSDASPFVELDALYKLVLSGVEDHHTLVRALEILVFARRVIADVTPAYIEWMAGLNEGDVLLLLDNLHSLMTVGGPRDPITFPHASFVDFLTDRSRAGIYYLDPSVANAHLALSTHKALFEYPRPSFIPTELGSLPRDCARAYFPFACSTDELLQYFASFQWQRAWEKLVWYPTPSESEDDAFIEAGIAWAIYVGALYTFCRLMAMQQSAWIPVHERLVAEFSKWFAPKYEDAKKRYPKKTHSWVRRFHLLNEQVVITCENLKAELGDCAVFPMFLSASNYFDPVTAVILHVMDNSWEDFANQSICNRAICEELLASFIERKLEGDGEDGTTIVAFEKCGVPRPDPYTWRVWFRRAVKWLLGAADRTPDIDRLLPQIEQRYISGYARTELGVRELQKAIRAYKQKRPSDSGRPRIGSQDPTRYNSWLSVEVPPYNRETILASIQSTVLCTSPNLNAVSSNGEDAGTNFTAWSSNVDKTLQQRNPDFLVAYMTCNCITGPSEFCRPCKSKDLGHRLEGLLIT